MHIFPSLPPLFLRFSFYILEGAPKNFAFAGLKYPGGDVNFVWWAGIANVSTLVKQSIRISSLLIGLSPSIQHYWFMDIDNGVAGMIQCQILPFFDADVVG
jgi:hypothetical protein